jgi:hypothetical protein
MALATVVVELVDEVGDVVVEPPNESPAIVVVELVDESPATLVVVAAVVVVTELGFTPSNA